MVQPLLAILNEDGSLPEEFRELIDDDDLLRALDLLIANRVIDWRFLTLQRRGRLGFYMTSTGEEATTIGAAYCLRSDNPLFLSYRLPMPSYRASAALPARISVAAFCRPSRIRSGPTR